MIAFGLHRNSRGQVTVKETSRESERRFYTQNPDKRCPCEIAEVEGVIVMCFCCVGPVGPPVYSHSTGDL